MDVDFVYPPTSKSLYQTLTSIDKDRMQFHAQGNNIPNFHVHAPNGMERLYLSKNKDVACRVGGSARHCANAVAELEMYRGITGRDVAEIVPAHAQLPSHVHALPNAYRSNHVEYNRQMSLEAVHDSFKQKYPQSYGFFTEPWTVRQQVCSGADCRNSTDMIADPKIHMNCTSRSAGRKF
jgi:hypothetical protein